MSKQEVYLELGLQPAEFLVWLVRNGGGQIWQGKLVEMTGWSKSTVSRSLSSLESDSVIKRIQIGRRKLVGIPGELPGIVSTLDDPQPSPRDGEKWALDESSIAGRAEPDTGAVLDVQLSVLPRIYLLAPGELDGFSSEVNNTRPDDTEDTGGESEGLWVGEIRWIQETRWPQ